MSKQATQRSTKKALEIVRSLQTQLSTRNKTVSIKDVINALVEEEKTLAKKREKVQKRQEKVDVMEAKLKANRKNKKAFVNEKRQDMVPTFEKHYDQDNRPVITVCTVKRRNKLYEGWAICSDIENPRHKKGENIALRRAAQALVTGKNTLPILREDALDIINCISVTPEDGMKSRCYKYKE